MVMFQPITEELLEPVLEILNSNSYYNTLVNGIPSRSIKEAKSIFLNQISESYLIILKDRYMGIIDFLKNNPNDNCPWIGLLMIHRDYHSMGYGKMAYLSFEERLKQQNYGNVRIGVLRENTNAKRYWTSLGFTLFENTQWEERQIDCYEKQLI